MYFIVYANYRIFSCTYTQKSNTHTVSYCCHSSDIIIFIFSAEETVTQTTLTIWAHVFIHSTDIYLVLIPCQVLCEEMEIKQGPCTIIPLKMFWMNIMAQLELDPIFWALSPLTFQICNSSEPQRAKEEMLENPCKNMLKVKNIIAIIYAIS